MITESAVRQNPGFWNWLVYRCMLAFLISSFILHSSFVFAGNEKDKDKDKDPKKHWGLIFGTAWGPDDRGLSGVKIKIHPVGQSRPHWQVVSGARGEFSQLVPPGPGDYLVTGEVEVIPVVDGVHQKKRKLHGERTVHIMNEEREDVGLHLAE